MPPKVISGGDNPYDIHDAKLSSSATAHESSSVTAHEISNINHSVCIYANPLSPFAETIAIPFQIFLMVFWHMFRDSAVLPRTSFQTTVGSNAVMTVKNFNSGICYLYINFLFDVFIRN